jgi:hypothetical protein
MKPEANNKIGSPSSTNLPQVIRKFLIVYLTSAVAVLGICFIFGWRSLENIGTGFLFGSLGLVLFGALLFAGNTVPAQLSKLSLPAVRHQEETENGGTPVMDEGRRFLFTTLICGGLLFVTGLILHIL